MVILLVAHMSPVLLVSTPSPKYLFLASKGAIGPISAFNNGPFPHSFCWVIKNGLYPERMEQLQEVVERGKQY